MVGVDSSDEGAVGGELELAADGGVGGDVVFHARRGPKRRLEVIG